MSSPVVSVIMPAFNSGSYIAESIESVIGQTFQNWELIIIDDGSTDDTDAIVKEYCSKDCRIKYIYQKNGRQGKARNNGINNSKGEYIAFLDSDDLWMPHRLETQLNFIVSNPTDLVYSDSYEFQDNLKKFECTMGIERTEFSGRVGVEKFLQANRIPILTVLCKKEALLNVGGFTENSKIQNAEDYHLWLKLLIAGYKFIGIDEVLTAYRVHSASVSQEDRGNNKQVFEALTELKSTNPEYEEAIDFFIKERFKNILFTLRDVEDKVLFNEIDKYLMYCDKSYYKMFFNLFRFLRMRSVAYRVVYFGLNYL